MTWGATSLLAVLAAVVGLVVGGFVASQCVEWYRISSFEGGSGYFVIGLALVGGLVGVVVALVIARSGWVGGGFGRQLLATAGSLLGLGLVIAVPSRLLADVPPEIDGDQLHITLEFKLAPGATDPRTLPGAPLVTLGASSGGTMRAREDGALFVEDTRSEDGRWVVPGAVRLFTERGQRLVSARVGDHEFGAWQIAPVSRRPREVSKDWSEWMPRAKDGAAPLPDGLRYRFKVIRVSDVLRTHDAGPFQVTTRTTYFYQVQGAERLAGMSSFGVTYRGVPVEGLQAARYVGVIPGATPALLVHDGESTQSGNCTLLVDDAGTLRRMEAGRCVAPLSPTLMTDDAAAFARQRAAAPVPGWVDVASFGVPGLYRLDHALLDARVPDVTPFDLPTDPFPQHPPGILGLSPDEQSVVWFAFGADGERSPQLGVTRWRSNESYVLPIERSLMRYREHAELDPAWVKHHFTWGKDAAGRDTLVRRASFTPLPHRGEVQTRGSGEYQACYLKPGSERLRAALWVWLKESFQATEAANTTTPEEPHLVIDGQAYDVSWVESGDFVSVSTYKGEAATIRRIGDAIDAMLATGRMDSLFGAEPSSTTR